MAKKEDTKELEPETKKFSSPTKGSLDLKEVIDEISKFINENSESSYRVVIGSDSQARHSHNAPEIDFVSAIVVHRIGHGGRYFYKKEKQKKKYVLRDKIYTETLMSLQLAEEVVPELRKAIPASTYDLEIHIDVGPLGPTRDMIKEVVGMVNGNGFKAKTKPDSWGASSVADKHT